MTSRYIFLDTETSGLSPQTDGVCEIAWIETDEDFKEVFRFSSLIDPEVPIKPGAQAVHGISDADVAEAPTLFELFAEVFDEHPFMEGDIVLAAHNLNFDAGFVGPYFPNGFEGMDTLRLARRLYPDADNHKLGTLAVWLGLESFNHKEAHGALADVVVLVDLTKRMTLDFDLTLPEMVELANEFVPVEVCKYKKHQGKKWTEVWKEDRQYVEWVLGQEWCKGDLRKTLERLKDSA